jgi:SAM-dependent methyltransferase
MANNDYSVYEKRYQKIFAEGKTQWSSDEGVAETLALVKRVIRPNWRTLLMGCGTGVLASRLSEFQPEVLGVDVSPTAIEYARQRMAGFANYRFEVANVCDLPDSFGLFDLIVDESCTHCIVLEDRKLLWQNVVAHLKPGGSLLVKTLAGHPPKVLERDPDMTYDMETSTLYYKKDTAIRHVTAIEKLQAELETHGLQIVFAELHIGEDDQARIHAKLPVGA